MANIKELAKQLALAIESNDEQKIKNLLEEINSKNYTNAELEELTNESAYDLENFESGLEDDLKIDKKIFKEILLENSTSSLANFIKKSKKNKK
ncbi:hypothetical protein ACNSOO_04620 [Aliarcobacter lanthieri]|uniref:hypothetical protein n=1 Tax=Aliarcobacter lanthieri TaxID=1355374 RepID=UPI003AAD2925